MDFQSFFFLVSFSSSVLFILKFFPQLPIVMSQKKSSKLSNEELEIQRVLDSPTSQSTASAPPSARVFNAQVFDARGERSGGDPLTFQSMQSLFRQFSQDLNETFMSLVGHSRKDTDRGPLESSDEDEVEDEVDDELPMDFNIDVAGPSNARLLDGFGINANEVPHSEEVVVEINAPAPGLAPREAPEVIV